MPATIFADYPCTGDRSICGTSVADDFKRDSQRLINSKVLVIDDAELTLRLVRNYLQKDGIENVLTCQRPDEALRTIRQAKPDLIILDLNMPQVSGIEILRDLRSSPETIDIPVIILTAHNEQEIRMEALALGANDFVTKPIVSYELLLRVRNLLEIRERHKELQKKSERLDFEVQRRTIALEAAEKHIVLCLARAAEYRDNDTGRHVIRVGKYAAIIASALGMDEQYVQKIEQAAQLHDIGKIGIPDRILLKAGKLDPDEFETMKTHCDLGSHVLQGTESERKSAFRNHISTGTAILSGLDSPFLQMAASVVATHHEKWDGTGYPRGLKGDCIPLEGRIVAVADVFDALSTKRPYKHAFPCEKCFEIIRHDRGSHFDPTIVDAFLGKARYVEEIQMQYSDLEEMTA